MTPPFNQRPHIYKHDSENSFSNNLVLNTYSDDQVLRKCNQDPYTVVQQYYNRFNAMWKVITSKDGGPLGVVTHFVWRLECQQRGAPHIHAKLWIRDAPVVGIDTEEDIKKFVLKYITCAIPDQQTSPLLYSRVDTFQRHKKCSRGVCLRHMRVKNKVISFCRFGYPRRATESFELHDVDKVVAERKLGVRREKMYSLPRTDAETRINDYNPWILSAWGANMDIQFIGEHSQKINLYLSGFVAFYCSKSLTSALLANLPVLYLQVYNKA
jgi:hypothetical protein